MDVKHVSLYVDDRPAEGVFRVHRDVYTDEALFELEMKHVFESTWNFVAIESDLNKPGDYVTAKVGRTPVLVSRGVDGKLAAFVNACRHKGATVARMEAGNTKYHVCPYHGWAYDASGKNVDIKDRAAGAYAPAFDADNHDLIPIARLESYKGLVFASLSADVPSLPDFLGDAKFFLDCVMDQGPHGMEFLPGRIAYTYRGNWKLQLDNGLDPYHLTSTHASFLDIQKRRRGGGGNVEARQFDWAKRARQNGGAYNFRHGHSVVWNRHPDPEMKPIFPALDEIRSRVGELRAEWIGNRLRQLSIFPNMQIPEAISQLLRTFHPIAPDLTEMRVHCLAPIGEDPELRARRLRQFEDFFNPTGIATPDDVIVYEECQLGFSGLGESWMQGYARGMTALRQGPDETAVELGISPEESAPGPFEQAPEVGFHAPYREWARMMEAGLAGRKAYA